jgi:exodeoxyribonuclease-5
MTEAADMVGVPELSSEQQRVADFLLKRLKSGAKQTVMGGLAGVGKTTLISWLIRCPDLRDKRIAVASLTGKAVSVLRKKGVSEAQTIHSLIYDPEEDVRGQTVFILKPFIDFDYIFIDEGSMTNAVLYADLLSFGIPLLFVGDIGQLEPIGDDPKLMTNPDITLTEIHRQAADSPIIQFAHALRRGQLFFPPVPGKLEFGNYDLFVDKLDEADQVICGFNKERHNINAAFRDSMDFPAKEILCPGDKIICLKNDKNFGIFNGLIGWVERIERIGGRTAIVDVKDEMGIVHHCLPMDTRQFGVDKIPFEQVDKELTLWDYGYCVTCHKSQGSEWDTVLVLEQVHQNWDRKRWTYTAATRAAKRLIYCR